MNDRLRARHWLASEQGSIVDRLKRDGRTEEEIEAEIRKAAHHIQPGKGEDLYLMAAGRGGRPAGLTTIEDDAALIDAISEMRRARRRVTMGTAAATAGFTLADLRGYLRVTGRTWLEFLHSF